MNRTKLMDKILGIKKRELLHRSYFPSGIHTMKKEKLEELLLLLEEKEKETKEKAEKRERELEHRFQIAEVFGPYLREVELENHQDWETFFGMLNYIPRLFSDLANLAADVKRMKENFSRWMEIKKRLGEMLPDVSLVSEQDEKRAFDQFQYDLSKIRPPQFSFGLMDRNNMTRVLERMGYQVEKIDPDEGIDS